MSETQIFHDSHSHFQNPPPSVIPPRAPTTDSGNDVLHITVPPGKFFSHYDLHIDASTLGSSASVTSAPVAGTTGTHDIKVHWAYGPFGKIAYTLTAYATDHAVTPSVSIDVGDPSWQQRSFDAIRQKLDLRLHLKGPDALALFNALRTGRRQPPVVPGLPGTSNIVVIDDIVIADVVAIAAILAVVAIVALLVVAVICVVAIQAHYKIDAQLVSKGPMPWDQELVLHLDPR
jgi:hypothetical protein